GPRTAQRDGLARTTGRDRLLSWSAAVRLPGSAHRPGSRRHLRRLQPALATQRAQGRAEWGADNPGRRPGPADLSRALSPHLRAGTLYGPPAGVLREDVLRPRRRSSGPDPAL